MNTNPPVFMPPIDLAHDIYSLAAQLEGFDHNLYQDIQYNQALYDSFQRWPRLFRLLIEHDETTTHEIQRTT